MKRIAVLGSTGSIGTQTLEIVRQNRDLQVTALAAGSNVERMEEQIREFCPLIAAMWSEEACRDLRVRVADTGVRICCGMEGLLEIAVMEEMDVLVTAIVGMIGIKPTIAAIESGKAIALANKETLVTAGHIIMCIRDREDALKHPNWAMGRKITIDSATMVNKGLEVMEAKWLFGVDLEQIEVVVHPQSVIHSMVEYKDGAVMAQLGMPDMKLPIAYALFYPDRRPMDGKKLDFFALGHMTFEKPDLETFTGLKLAFEAARTGGSMPTVYNAANERAVSLFLERKIDFLQIPELIGACMGQHKVIEHPNVEEILRTEQEAYEYIRRVVN